MPHFLERMRLAEEPGIFAWMDQGEEDFARTLDTEIHGGRLRADQATQAYTMFQRGEENAAEDLVVQMVAANLQAAATGQAPLLPTAPGMPGGAVAAPLIPGMPTLGAAPAARAARGKVATLVVRQSPTGQVELLSTTPGRPALYQRDMTAAKRLKRVGKKISRLFPKRRGRKKVFKAAGHAIA